MLTVSVKREQGFRLGRDGIQNPLRLGARYEEQATEHRRNVTPDFLPSKHRVRNSPFLADYEAIDISLRAALFRICRVARFTCTICRP